MASSMSGKDTTWGRPFWITIAIASIIWWVIAGEWSMQRSLLLVWMSLSAFTVGALVGFLFSSYGEEASTLGKIRDWLVGGIAGLTAAKAGSIKALVVVFAAGPGPTEFAFAVGAGVFYLGLGFYFMFLQRELILNVLLARSRAERGAIDGSQQTFQVIQRFLLRLPASILTGVDYIDQIPDMNEKEIKELKDSLYSEDVNTFLKQAEDAATKGMLDWDTISKSAYICSYRTYFQKDDQAAIDNAIKWITRALNMNPLHVDLTLRYADMLGAKEDYASAVAVLERLALRTEAPIFVREWLGYYLRFQPDRADDAIRYSEEYHSLFPDETDSFFNISYACAQKYSDELVKTGQSQNLESKNREKALSKLRQALLDQPKMAETIRDKWKFECLLHDKEFRTLVGFPPEESAAGTSPKVQAV